MVKSISLYICGIIVISAPALLSQGLTKDAFADADYPCLPIPQERACLPGTLNVVAKVTNLTIDSLSNGLMVNATVTIFYNLNSSVIYILQITDNDKNGETVYINWKPVSMNPATRNDDRFVYDYFETIQQDSVSLEQGHYSIKIMVWTEIDGTFYPLILQPETRTSIVI